VDVQILEQEDKAVTDRPSPQQLGMAVAARELCLRQLPRLSRFCIVNTCRFSTDPPRPRYPPPPSPPGSNANPRLHSLIFAGTHVSNLVQPDVLLAAIRSNKLPRSTPSPSRDDETQFRPASIDGTLATNPDDGQHGESRIVPMKISEREPGYIFVHAVATGRNIHITITDHKRNPLISMSAGQIGLKHSKRGTIEAGLETSIRAFKKLADLSRDIEKVEIVLKGFRLGRSGFLTALMGQQGDFLRSKIVRITDATPLRIGSSKVRNTKRR